jgi:hypothetical protein
MRGQWSEKKNPHNEARAWDETVQGRSDLILPREHDRENPCGLFRIRRVFGPGHHVIVVVVDLPKELLVSGLEPAEIALFIWVVAFIEVIEGLGPNEHTRPHIQWEICLNYMILLAVPTEVGQ